jgi:hypothetical protein
LKPDWHVSYCPVTRAVSGSTIHVG